MAKISCNVISYILKRTVDITVIIPSPAISEPVGMNGTKPSHNPVQKYPVLYLLHGEGNNQTAWTGYTNVELYAEERNIAVVLISGENKFHVNHPWSDHYFDFMAKELPEFIYNMFPVSRRPEDTYIAGLSLGGFGTLIHALNRPDDFAAFGAFSPAIALKSLQLYEEADERFIPAKAAKTLAAKGTKFPKLYLACGTEDFLYQADLDFKNLLLELNIDLKWISLLNYGHEWRFWDLQIEAFLDWIPRTDYYAQKINRQI